MVCYLLFQIGYLSFTLRAVSFFIPKRQVNLNLLITDLNAGKFMIGEMDEVTNFF